MLNTITANVNFFIKFFNVNPPINHPIHGLLGQTNNNHYKL